jgi:hypothetical protein
MNPSALFSAEFMLSASTGFATAGAGRVIMKRACGSAAAAGYASQVHRSQLLQRCVPRTCAENQLAQRIAFI